MSVRSLCNSTATVSYATYSRTSQGSSSRSWTARHANMPCRIQPVSGGEAAKFRSYRMDVSHKMFVPGEYTGIVSTDKVACGGVTYDIVLVRDIDLMGHHHELLLDSTAEALE